MSTESLCSYICNVASWFYYLMSLFFKEIYYYYYNCSCVADKIDLFRTHRNSSRRSNSVRIIYARQWIHSASYIRTIQTSYIIILQCRDACLCIIRERDFLTKFSSMSWFLILWKLSSLVIWFQQEFVHFLDFLPWLWIKLYHLCFWFNQVFKCLFYILASNFIKLFSSHLIIISKLFSYCYEYPAEVFSPWLQIRCIFLVSNYINAPSFDAWSLIPLLLLTFNLINVFFFRFLIIS